MPSVKLSPLFNGQTVDAEGPAAGYKINAYAAGSSERLTTYISSAGAVPQTNPIILDSNGYPTNGQIWLQAGRNYKFVLTDPDDNVIKTFDNLSGINDASVSASEWQASGLTPTYINAGSFSVPGDQVSEFHPGRRLELTMSGGTAYGTIVSSVYSTLTTVVMSMDSGTLDPGLNVVNLSILSAINSAVPPISPNSASEALRGEAEIATQAETDAGTDDARIVTPKKLTAWVKQATESVLGMAKVATQTQTNAGTDDATMVTPKKLRWGFAASIGSAGYIVLPTWLGGLILQWGPTTASPGGTTTSFPIAFPSACYGVLTQVAGSTSALVSVSVEVTSTAAFKLYASSGTLSVYMFAFGK